MTHLGSFGQNFAGRFMGVFEPTRFTVYGNPNEEVRNALVDFGAAYLGVLGGFVR